MPHFAKRIFIFLSLSMFGFWMVHYKYQLNHVSFTRVSESSLSTDCLGGPKKNLMFLKTHKTGSSTLQNILLRYAYKNKLFLGIPTEAIFHYRAGEKHKRSFMKETPENKTVNMMLHHMAFNKKEVAATLPPDTFYITILRDPAIQFESVYKYMFSALKAFQRVPREGGMKEYLRHPTRYFKVDDGDRWWFGKNNIMYDLGFNNLNETDEYIQETIEEIDKIFGFILISEYYDIALLLLKDLLCWDIKDMIYFTMNARNKSTVETMTSDVMDLAYKWNKADTALYKYYNKTFWRRVEKYGKDRLEKDLIELERLKNVAQNFCIKDEMQNNKDIEDNALKLHNPENIDLAQYQLKEQAKNNETCIGMITPEHAWYKKFDRLQYQNS